MSVSMIGALALILLISAIIIGYFTKVNTGLIAMTLGFLFAICLIPLANNQEFISEYASQYDEAKSEIFVNSFGSIKKIGTFFSKSYATNLFLTIFGMTLLFSVARVNKTLEYIARKSTSLVAGKNKLVPLVYFAIATILAAVGPGNIAVCAILLPIALQVASEEKISSLLMASCVIAGSNAGGLSPIAPTGIVAERLSAEVMGSPEIGSEIAMAIWKNMIIGQVIFVIITYLLFKGFKIPNSINTGASKLELNKFQIQTMVVIGAVVASIVGLGMMGIKLHVGFAGIIGATILLILRVADEKKVIASVPWSTIIMITGVGLMIAVVKTAGGIDYLSQILEKLMAERTAGPIFAILGGLMSMVSSASGVVMPTLIPTAPEIANTLVLDPISLIVAIVLGAHFVTTSPVSTLGGLAMASIDEEVDKNVFFNGLFILGIAGNILVAILIFFGILG